MSFHLWNTWPQHTTCSDCLMLWFSSTYRQTSVFFLTSKISVNRQSGFLALHFLTIIGGPGDIGLLYINLSELETIDAWRIDLNYSISSYLPADVYIFLKFSRHLCSYIAQLLKYWSIPIVTICFFVNMTATTFKNDTLLFKWFDLNN